MASYVALLRGINVGGRNKVAMADLRRVVEEVGHTDVRTYVNSGNVVFDAKGRASAKQGDQLAAAIEKAVRSELGVPSAVIVRSAAELGRVVRANPYADESDPKKVHVGFLASPLSPDQRKAAKTTEQEAAERGSPDELTIGRREIYLHTPDGLGRSVLAELLTRKKNAAAGAGTMRNWSTVTKLAAMLSDR